MLFMKKMCDVFVEP